MEESDVVKIASAVRAVLPDVRAIYVFGSRTRGHENAESDLDIAVLMPGKLPPVRVFELCNALSRALRVEVDLVDLRSVSTVLNFEVIRTGRRVFCVDVHECCAHEALQMSLYYKLNEERAAIIESIYERARA